VPALVSDLTVLRPPVTAVGPQTCRSGRTADANWQARSRPAASSAQAARSHAAAPDRGFSKWHDSLRHAPGRENAASTGHSGGNVLHPPAGMGPSHAARTPPPLTAQVTPISQATV